MAKQILISDNGIARQASFLEIAGLTAHSQVVRDTGAVGSTIIPAELLPGAIYVRSGPGVAFSDTLPTAALMTAAYPDALIGDSWEVEIANRTAFVETLLAGVGFTLVGAGGAIIEANQTVTVIVRKNTASTWNLEII